MAESCKKGHESHQIAILVSQNIDSAKVLLSSLAPHVDQYSRVASQLARFKLWVGSLGAHRWSGRRSLDYRLRDASSIRQHIVLLLDQLGEAMKDALSTSSNSGAPAMEVHDLLDPELMHYLVDDDDSTQSSLDKALDDIGHVVDCMLRLSVAIRNPAPHDQYMSRAGLQTLAYYEPYDIRHVQEKFSRIENKLAARLGAAITARRHFFQYREDHHARLSNGIGDDDSLTESGDQTTHASSIPERLKDTLDEDPLIGLDVQSVVSATSYAPSSYNVDELRVPPIPKEYLTGPFLCPFCYLIIEINSRYDWKKHVFRDLQPYVCLAPSCSVQYHRFSRRSDWFQHMKKAHWRLWQCYCGRHEVFNNAEEFHDHLRKTHLSDLTLQQQDTFRQMCSQVDLSQATGPCPLCVEVHISSATQYVTHISHHLEQLALFALPQIINENDGTGSQNDSSEGKDDSLESRVSNLIINESQPGEQAASISWRGDDQEHNSPESPQAVQEGATSESGLPIFQSDDAKNAEDNVHDSARTMVVSDQNVSRTSRVITQRTSSNPTSSETGGSTNMARSEYPKEGKTRIPLRLISIRAIVELQYPYVIEEDTVIVQKLLGQHNVDNLLRLSEDYKRIDAEPTHLQL
ncbi:hypothetical protein F4860DRAFT_513568 [Xylaria cubensis]|nr:hypothetical protein F4860DRAFT_513568 [Xylaria cubensis]